ncbi:hypothetical protein KPSA3_03592 [Pseudomonas syringae pv. actinidiae]|uniref:Uncharacterized protein n=1 Tax=Pseudomonas syringae pv. actinidiae TaxID=103796 RepID=A0AAN4Q5D9_PSESF|nr:hypothetical protein KPSA3_03592 [Pseudomonas syringae pv. actinidiae]
MTQSVTKCIPTRACGTMTFGRTLIVPTLRVGMQFWTLCVRYWLRRSAEYVSKRRRLAR